MSRFNLKLLTAAYLPAYIEKQPLTIHKHITRLRKIEPSLDFVSFLVSSSIFSSRIEGNMMDLNDYYRFSEMGLKKTKPVHEIDDLIKAYQYARKSSISEKKVLTAHKYLTNTLLGGNSHYQGAYRDKEVTIRHVNTGKIVYRGAQIVELQQEMGKLVDDMASLISMDLTHNEIFYFAAQIHLRFAQIHPFADGNGRTARLLEKWFLSEMLGDVAWYIQSERNYQRRIVSYYRNVSLGDTYESVDYKHCLPFLLMLPWSLRIKAK